MHTPHHLTLDFHQASDYPYVFLVLLSRPALVRFILFQFQYVNPIIILGGVVALVGLLDRQVEIPGNDVRWLVVYSHDGVRSQVGGLECVPSIHVMEVLRGINSLNACVIPGREW